MDKDYNKGLKIGLGFITIIGLLLGIVYAVGFHTANEILPGQFATGNYSFNGNLGIGTSNPTSTLEVNGSLRVSGNTYGIIPIGTKLEIYNLTECPNYYSLIRNKTINFSPIGTEIGNMIEGNGLSAGFDGNISQTGSGTIAPWKSGTGTGYIGKNWGNEGYIITGFKAWGTIDDGFKNVASSIITLTLQGSTDNFGTNIVDLGSISFTDPNNNTLKEKLSGLIEIKYPYHRLKIQSSVGTSGIGISELEFVGNYSTIICSKN